MKWLLKLFLSKKAKGTPTPPPVAVDVLLKEDGFRLLLETGDGLLL